MTTRELTIRIDLDAFERRHGWIELVWDSGEDSARARWRFEDFSAATPAVEGQKILHREVSTEIRTMAGGCMGLAEGDCSDGCGLDGTSWVLSLRAADVERQWSCWERERPSHRPVGELVRRVLSLVD